MSSFTIKDIENLSGIKAHTIRIWEQRYSFLKPKRTDTNIRYYCNEEVKAILDISLLNKCGHKISSIDGMDAKEILQKISCLDDGCIHQEKLVHELLKKMIDLDMRSFEKIIDDHINTQGIEKTIIELLFPFMEKIGFMWESGRIRPVQEHLVGNIIRQKLITGIESTIARERTDTTFLLFLPEGEHHEMGLLCMYYLLRSQGANIIYLGANVPMKDLEYIVRIKQPDILYTHLTSPINDLHFDKFLKSVAKLSPGPILISGWSTKHYRKKLPAHIEFKSSLSEMLEYLTFI
jgi:methanogenic corrinoid protein MtbC1